MAKKEKAKGEAKGNKQNTGFKVSWFDKIPYWIKAIIVKWWFYGMIYFFFVMGLAGLVGAESFTTVIQIVVICFACGVVTDLFTNNVLDVVESKPHQVDWWAFCHGKKFIGFLINVVFGIVVGLATSLTCGAFTSLIDAALVANGSTDATYFFREPCSFALVALIYDLALVGIKDLIVYFINKHKTPEGEGLINGN